MDKKQDVSLQHALGHGKTNSMLGCINKRMNIRLREVISSLLSHFHNTSTAFLRPHLECGVQVWGHQHKEDEKLLEWIIFLLTRFHGRGTFLSSESDAVHHGTGQLKERRQCLTTRLLRFLASANICHEYRYIMCQSLGK